MKSINYYSRYRQIRPLVDSSTTVTLFTVTNTVKRIEHKIGTLI